MSEPVELRGESDAAYTARLAEAWTGEVAKYDRTLLTLSTGALALSAALVRDLAGLEHQELLAWAWALILVDLFMTLASSAFSKAAIEARWSEFDLGVGKSRGEHLGKVAWWLSLVAGVLFAVGAVLLMRFAWLNI